MSSTTIFKVRPATLRDAKSIAELHNATAREAFKSMIGDVPIADVPLDKRQAYWREAIEYSEPQVQVVLDDDKIIGFVGFDRSRDKGTPPTMGEIWAIYVAAAYWGQGCWRGFVGRSPRRPARRRLYPRIVWVPLANDRAMRFHELAGFKREMSSAKTVAIGAVKVEEIRLKRRWLKSFAPPRYQSSSRRQTSKSPPHRHFESRPCGGETR